MALHQWKNVFLSTDFMLCHQNSHSITPFTHSTECVHLSSCIKTGAFAAQDKMCLLNVWKNESDSIQDMRWGFITSSNVSQLRMAYEFVPFCNNRYTITYYHKTTVDILMALVYWRLYNVTLQTTTTTHICLNIY